MSDMNDDDITTEPDEPTEAEENLDAGGEGPQDTGDEES
jgi:hypothetical protein